MNMSHFIYTKYTNPNPENALATAIHFYSGGEYAREDVRVERDGHVISCKL